MMARTIASHADNYGLDLQEDMLMINYAKDLTYRECAVKRRG